MLLCYPPIETKKVDADVLETFFLMYTPPMLQLLMLHVQYYPFKHPLCYTLSGFHHIINFHSAVA